MTWTLPPDAWPTVAAMLELIPGPWPEDLARHDLAFLRWEVAEGHRPRQPGRGLLAARWGWTGHQVRAFLEANPRPSPARHRPEIHAIPVRPVVPVITAPAVTSPPPAGRQPAASPSIASPVDNPPAPARRQPVASSDTVEAGQSADIRQPVASPSPPPPAPPPPHTPPPDLSSQVDLHVEDRSGGGTGEDPPATMPEGLAATAAALPEARVFLRVWTRWRNHPKAPQRWTGGPSEALAWFLELVASTPDTPMGKALAALDVAASLEDWDAWLADRADEHGRPGTAGRSKFPRGWKNALRTWFTNQVKYGRNLKAKARRRGAWAGRATQFQGHADPVAPTDPRPCTPTGDPDALDRF